MEGRSNLETVDSEAVRSFASATLKAPLQKFASLTVLMRLHVMTAFIITTICFLVWHYTNDVSSTTTEWWWIYPFFLFALTLTVHTFVSSEQYMKAVVSAVLIINLMLFVADGLTSYTGYPRWFVYPWVISVMVMLAVYHFTSSKTTLLQLCFYEYVLLMIIFFLIWVETSWVPAPPPGPNPGPPTSRPFPWFLIPLCILAVPLMIGHVRNTYQEFRLWTHASITLAAINILLFFIWGFQDSQIPWFLFVWIASAGVIGFVWWRYLRVREDDHPYGGAYPDQMASAGFSSPYTPVSSVSYQSASATEAYQASSDIPTSIGGVYQQDTDSYQGGATAYQGGEESDRTYEAI